MEQELKSESEFRSIPRTLETEKKNWKLFSGSILCTVGFEEEKRNVDLMEIQFVL